jgi:hypothetical protein
MVEAVAAAQGLLVFKVLQLMGGMAVLELHLLFQAQ